MERGGWESLRIPAIATKAERFPIGAGLFCDREPGEILKPKRYSLEQLEIACREPRSGKTCPPGGRLRASGSRIKPAAAREAREAEFLERWRLVFGVGPF
jgi:hypothetical protein